MKMFFQMMRDGFQREVITAGDHQRRFFCFRQNHLLKQKSARFGLIIFFGHFSRFADFDHLNEARRIEARGCDAGPRPGIA